MNKGVALCGLLLAALLATMSTVVVASPDDEELWQERLRFDGLPVLSLRIRNDIGAARPTRFARVS